MPQTENKRLWEAIHEVALILSATGALYTNDEMGQKILALDDEYRKEKNDD